MDGQLLAAVVYIGLGLVPAIVAAIPWRHRDNPGGLPLTIAFVGAAGTGVFHGMQLLTPGVIASPVLSFLVAAGVRMSLSVAVLGIFYLAVEYTGRTWLKQRRILVGLVCLTVVLGLGTVAVQYLPDVPFSTLLVTSNEGLTVLLSVVSLAFFGEQFLDSRGLFRKQSGALFVGVGVSTILGVVQILLRPPVFNLASVGATIGTIIIALALFRYEFLQTVPVAREMLFEQITDPVVALDGVGHIADYNDAAATLFGFGEGIVGITLDELFSTTPALVARHADVLDGEDIGAIIDGGQRHFDRDHPVVSTLLDGDTFDVDDTTIGIDADGDTRHFSVTVSEFTSTPPYSGRLVVFRDITPQKRREDELDLLKQVLSRVLRHNLRNDITAIKGYAEMVEKKGDDEVAELATKIRSTGEDLMQTSQVARRIEDVLDADGLVDVPLDGVVEAVVADLREVHPDAEYELSLPEGTVVRANPLLGAALKATIENGVVHSEADTPRVTVTAQQDGPWIALTIRDNGPGLPDHEREALQDQTETALVHSSGAGLWLTDTVIRESNGKLSYRTDDGTVVRMYLRAADAPGEHEREVPT